jgi:hypothetical protein
MWWWIAAGALCAISAALLVWWLLRRRRTQDAALAAAWSAVAAAVAGSETVWLVLAPAGSGAGDLLAGSGLAWRARPAATADPALPQAWRHEGGSLVELPAAWCTSASERRWQASLPRLARLPIAGVLAAVPLAELVRKGPEHAAGVAAALRLRCAELSERLGATLPLHLVLSRADLLGGWKDFFAGIAEVERQQPLGVGLPWPPADAAAWAAAWPGVAEALRARRPLGMARARDGDAALKLMRFPGQLDELARPAGELVERLAAPGGPGLRGVWLASSHRAAPIAPAASRSGARSDPERSVYLGALRAAPSSGGDAHFVHRLLAAVLPQDRGLALPNAARRRRRVIAAWSLQLAIPVVLAAWAAWLGVAAWRGGAAADDLRAAAGEVLAAERLHAADAMRNLDAVDRLGAAVAAAAAGDHPAARAVIRAGAALYARRIGELCGLNARDALAADMAALRAAPQAGGDRLHDCYRAWAMLTGGLAPDAALLERELEDGRRWYRALEPEGRRLDWPAEALARRQLQRLARELLPRRLAALPGDPALAEAVARELGESVWISRAWDAALRAARGQFAPPPPPPADAPLRVAAWPEGALTRAALDGGFAALLDEQADAAARTLAGLGIDAPRAVVRRRLRERFRIEHRRAWLGALASTSATVEGCAALPAATTAVAGPASPWPSLAGRILEELGEGGERAWIAESLQPLAALRGEADGFLAAAGEGRRTADLERLVLLARRWDEAVSAAQARLAGVQPEDLRAAAAAGLAGLARGLWAPIDRAAGGELDAAWRAAVVPVWRRDCAGRYPFAGAALDEVPAARFAAFANPVDGVLRRSMAPIERLRAQPVAGRPALSVAPAYADLARRAAAMQAALFADGGNRMLVPCQLALIQREGVADIAVAIGTGSARLYDRPDGRAELAVRQGEPCAAKIAIRTVTGAWQTREGQGRDWGWLRLLREGSPRPAADGAGWILDWSFDGGAAGGGVRWHAQALIESSPLGEAVGGDLLGGFSVPEAIAAGADGA